MYVAKKPHFVAGKMSADWPDEWIFFCSMDMRAAQAEIAPRVQPLWLRVR
jgi:hypothetical protein